MNSPRGTSSSSRRRAPILPCCQPYQFPPTKRKRARSSRALLSPSRWTFLQLHRHRLHLGIVRQPILPELAPNTRLFKSSERRRGVEHVVAIHPNRSGSDSISNRMRLGYILGPNRSSQAVQRFIRPVHHFVDVLELQDRHHRTEDLFLGDLHIVLYVGEYCRFDEVALIANAIPSGQQLGIFLLPGFDIAHHFVELILIHLWTLLGILVERIADSPFLGTIHAPGHEFVVALFFHEESRPRAAALPLIEEQRKVRAFDRLIHVRIGEHDVRAFPA